MTIKGMGIDAAALAERRSPPSERADRGMTDLYRRFVRPELTEKLASVDMDRVYYKAEADYLYHRDAGGREKRVLDLVGGYGGTFFGHNHPELIGEAMLCFARKVPFLAQGSIRAGSARLASVLSDRVGRHTGQEYVTTFANSGTEVVEAALKHALLERHLARERIEGGIRDRIILLRKEVRRRPETVRAESLAEAASSLGLPSDATFEQVSEAVLTRNRETLAAAPVLLARAKGFHGKTLGALQVTSNPDFREPFASPGGWTVEFLGDERAEWESALGRHGCELLDLSAGFSGDVSLRRTPMSRIAAALVEPVLGEGGIRLLPKAIVDLLEGKAERAFPVIVDEIQTGMGRTGRFLASEWIGLRGDYYCLGKSLGGGLAKIGALLIPRDRFIPEFSILHTSTFAEDDFASAVSLKALELLELDPQRPIEAAEKKGAYFLKALGRLKERYPDVIAEVRGLGLMIGVELAHLEPCRSWLIRAARNQKLLGYLISGYLLNERGIRIFPTLSSPDTLRIEPSYHIEIGEVDAFVEALEDVCRLLRRGDLYRLGRFLVRLEDGTREGTGCRVQMGFDRAEARPRVAFLGHFIDVAGIKHRDPGLESMPEGMMAEFFAKTRNLFRQGEPLESINVRSATGAEVNLTFIGHYLTSEVIHNALRENDFEWIRERVVDSVRLARDRGCRVVGFGGYTSIVTRNCQLVPVEGIALTSGNSLTVAMAVEAIRRTARDKGMDVAKACLGVVGATGNIGSIYSRILAEDAGRVLLFGSESGLRRLRKVALRILSDMSREIRARPAADLRGLARTLAERPGLFRMVAASDREEDLKDRLDAMYADHGLGDILGLSTDLTRLRECDLIVSASNEAGCIIHPETLDNRETVICDIAVPRDTSPFLEIRRPNTTVIQGGIVGLPANPDFRIGGIPLGEGRSFACMAETLLMGLEGMREDFSVGEVTKEQVRRIEDVARRHGFTLAERKVSASY